MGRQEGRDVAPAVAPGKPAVPHDEPMPGKPDAAAVTNSALLAEQTAGLQNRRQMSDHRIDLGGGQPAVPPSEKGPELPTAVAPHDLAVDALETLRHECAGMGTMAFGTALLIERMAVAGLRQGGPAAGD